MSLNLGDIIKIKDIDNVPLLECRIVAVDGLSTGRLHYLLEPLIHNNYVLLAERKYIINDLVVKDCLNQNIKCDPDLTNKTLIRSGCGGWIWWSQKNILEHIISDDDNDNEDRGGLRYL